MDAATALTPMVHRLFDGPSPVRIELWDGSAVGPYGADATIRVRSPRALRRMATAPGELGMARAYVAGDARQRPWLRARSSLQATRLARSSSR